jgi:hypothetical protein
MVLLAAAPAAPGEHARDLPRPEASLVVAPGTEGPGSRPGTDPRPADLTLVFFDPAGVLRTGFEPLAEEVRSIFRGLGVEVSWRADGSYGESPIPEVPVILLERRPGRRPGPERIMGLVMRDQQPQRAVWLFAENVRFTLGRPGRPGPPDPELDLSLARALARVAAHEIVHAMAPDEPHASEGLMRHALGKKFLLGAQAPIDARCARTFLARLSEEGRRFFTRFTAGTAPLPKDAEATSSLATPELAPPNR